MSFPETHIHRNYCIVDKSSHKFKPFNLQDKISGLICVFPGEKTLLCRTFPTDNFNPPCPTRVKTYCLHPYCDCCSIDLSRQSCPLGKDRQAVGRGFPGSGGIEYARRRLVDSLCLASSPHTSPLWSTLTVLVSQFQLAIIMK